MKSEPSSIHFTKMHALGNDFVVINALQQPLMTSTLPISHLAHRHTGIGFDQLLIIEPSQRADFFCRIYNADGSEAEQCGNGLRCIARFIHEEKLHPSLSFCLETKAGLFPVTIKDYDQISVTMGLPQIQKTLMPLLLSKTDTVLLSLLSVGNPHAIMKVASIDTLLAEQLGFEIATHTYFSQGTNVGFMQIMTPHHIRLRTIERGVGETFACGSNACAAVAAGIANGWLEKQVRVEFHYGSLFIHWESNDKPIQMTGPASRIFIGKISS